MAAELPGFLGHNGPYEAQRTRRFCCGGTTLC